MNVKFVPSISFISCKSQFLAKLQDKNALPQVQYLARLTREYGNDIVKLIVNNQYRSLDELYNDIVVASERAQKYLYISVNKFLVYSTVDTIVTTRDFDLILVEYCQDAIANKFTLLEYTIKPNDNGTLGNFLHPVTTMFFKRNE